MTVEWQTHFRLETAALQGEQDSIFEFASWFNFTYLFKSETALRLFFFFLHTSFLSLEPLISVSAHHSSTTTFTQRHSLQPRIMRSASWLLTRAQLPDSDEHILISYKSRRPREETVQIKSESRRTKALENSIKRTICLANMTSVRSAFESQQDGAEKHDETFRSLFKHTELLAPGVYVRLQLFLLRWFSLLQGNCHPAVSNWGSLQKTCLDHHPQLLSVL